MLQIRRVVDRDWNLWHYAMTPEWRHDGHDNNWLLLELLLALPFAIGYKTEAVSRALAATMLAEALTCWNFLASWPSWCAHAVSHQIEATELRAMRSLFPQAVL